MAPAASDEVRELHALVRSRPFLVGTDVARSILQRRDAGGGDDVAVALVASSADALFWNGEKVRVSIHRYAGRATAGVARLATVVEMKESKRLLDEQTKGAAKGL
jgi:hypothetical protein